MTRLVVCGLIGFAAVCLAAPHKVDPQEEKGNSGHSYNVAHLGHRGTPDQPQETDDGDRDYPGGGSYPGGGGGYFPRSTQWRSSRVRRNYEGDLHGYGPRYGYGHNRPYSRGAYSYPAAPAQSHSYSKASASASSGSGGLGR